MITEFFLSALPWVACGLMVAIICTGFYYTTANKKENAGCTQTEGKCGKTAPLATYFYIAALIGFVTAFILWLSDHGTSHAIVWMSISSMFLCIGSAQTLKEQKKKDSDGGE